MPRYPIHRLPAAALTYRLSMTILHAIIYLVILYGLYLFLNALSLPATITKLPLYLITLTISITGITMLYQRAWHQHLSFVLLPEMFVLRQGVYWQHDIRMARERIQYVDVQQSPLARRFGLAKLSVYTAGSMLQTVHIKGLSLEQAHEIRRELVGAQDE